MLELTKKSYRGELYFARNEILCPISHSPYNAVASRCANANPILIGNLLVVGLTQNLRNYVRDVSAACSLEQAIATYMSFGHATLTQKLWDCFPARSDRRNDKSMSYGHATLSLRKS